MSEPVTHGFIAHCIKGNCGPFEVHAPDISSARAQAMAHFRAKMPRRKLYGDDVTCLIAERNTAGGTRKGEQVTHLPLF